MPHEILKFNEDQNLVFGWASMSVEDGAPVVDSQSDVIEPVELEKAAYDYVLNFRDTGEMHKGGSVGKLVESFVMTPEKMTAMGLPASDNVGWWVGFKVYDDNVFSNIKNGMYSMFSIQGMAEKESV